MLVLQLNMGLNLNPLKYFAKGIQSPVENKKQTPKPKKHHQPTNQLKKTPKNQTKNKPNKNSKLTTNQRSNHYSFALESLHLCLMMKEN